jgi:hypothetical protein
MAHIPAGAIGDDRRDGYNSRGVALGPLRSRLAGAPQFPFPRPISLRLRAWNPPN